MTKPSHVAIIGGGPAGLMAAEVLAAGGAQVEVFDAMPSVARKFLMAGKGGMNITHSEPFEAFLARYGERRPHMEPLLAAFGPDALRDWIHGLGIDTFIGSSGRVFPTDMKAAPLLRAWLHRLRQAGVVFHVRHRWLGWNGDSPVFATPEGEITRTFDGTILALGGGSWKKLGSDGTWVPLLVARGVVVAPLKPANCGFDSAGWTEHFREKHAGEPVKPVVATVTDVHGIEHRRQGEFVITAGGVEGGLIYALSSPLRECIAATGEGQLTLDLLPDLDTQRVQTEVAHPRGARSLSSHLQSRLGLKGVKMGLLHEILTKEEFNDPARLAAAIKKLPVRLISPRPIDEAISSAGGVPFEALDAGLMLKALPGIFCAGEMLDWEAPTGGYLLTACFASGRAAGLGVLNWLNTLHFVGK